MALKFFRGGGWISRNYSCRSEFCGSGGASFRNMDLSFRLALTTGDSMTQKHSDHLRGGSLGSSAKHCRSARMLPDSPLGSVFDPGSDLGFRLSTTTPTKSMTTATATDMLLNAIARDPGDDTAWFALADALEEAGDPSAEATRISVMLRRTQAHKIQRTYEPRLRELLHAGVRVTLPRRRVSLSRFVSLDMVLIPPGTFLMGSPPDEPNRRDNEEQKLVTISKGFWMSIYPVTQAQWQAVMGENPSHFKGENLPVETVSWDDCQEMAKKLSERANLEFGLPSEASWEHSCRAGTTTPFAFGDTLTTDQANFDGRYPYAGGPKGDFRSTTTPVDMFPANAWGLHDMHGNVWEWCADFFSDPGVAEEAPGSSEEKNTSDQDSVGREKTSGTDTSASASALEGEQSGPFSGAGAGSTRGTTHADQAGDTRGREGMQPSSTGSGLEPGEDEQGRPFGTEETGGFSEEDAGSEPANRVSVPTAHLAGMPVIAGTASAFAHVIDPTGPRDGRTRVIRGGSLCNVGANCRSALRIGGVPSYRTRLMGFRLMAKERRNGSKTESSSEARW